MHFIGWYWKRIKQRSQRNKSKDLNQYSKFIDKCPNYFRPSLALGSAVADGYVPAAAALGFNADAEGLAELDSCIINNQSDSIVSQFAIRCRVPEVDFYKDVFKPELSASSYMRSAKIFQDPKQIRSRTVSISPRNPQWSVRIQKFRDSPMSSSNVFSLESTSSLLGIGVHRKEAHSSLAVESSLLTTVIAASNDASPCLSYDMYFFSMQTFFRTYIYISRAFSATGNNSITASITFKPSFWEPFRAAKFASLSKWNHKVCQPIRRT